MQENELKVSSGWPVLFAVLAAPFAAAWLIWMGVKTQDALPFVALGVLGLAWLISLPGFFIVNPNEAKVIQLFGKYVGTVKQVGFHYGNPFYWKQKVSMRVQTFETGIIESPDKKDAAGKVLQSGTRRRQPSKVNDRDGTPIDIAAVVVYRVVNTAHAVFQVTSYEDFVHIQSESALRTMASQYSYDSQDDLAHSLRGQTAEVAEKLKHEIQERIKIAGIEIIEARISYLAYAPEIAAAMLQRQQATALIAARQKIVEGAVGMVEHALEMLTEKKVVDLDADRRAAMVSNLLVVLCGHQTAQPVVNTGDDLPVTQAMVGFDWEGEAPAEPCLPARQEPRPLVAGILQASRVKTMPERKSFLLRIDPEVLLNVQRWADEDLRSLNGQIEFLLRRALADRLKKKDTDSQRPADELK